MCEYGNALETPEHFTHVGLNLSNYSGMINNINLTGERYNIQYTQRRVQPDQCYFTVQITGSHFEQFITNELILQLVDTKYKMPRYCGYII